MRYAGDSLGDAARKVVFESVGGVGGHGGLIAVDRAGQLAMPFSTAGMYRGWVRAGAAPATRIFAG